MTGNPPTAAALADRASRLNDSLGASSRRSSSAIEMARFFAILMVVQTHVVFSAKQIETLNLSLSPAFSSWQYFSGQVLGSLGTPLLSALSGYLLARGIVQYDLGTYVSKLRVRLRTLLVPYLFWECWGLLVFWLASVTTSRRFEAFDDVGSLFHALFIEPVVFPLWFMRDLLLHAVLSPIYWFLLKHSRGIVILLVLVFLLLNPQYGRGVTIRLDNLAAYLTGVWIAMMTPATFERVRNVLPWAVATGAAFFGAGFFLSKLGYPLILGPSAWRILFKFAACGAIWYLLRFFQFPRLAFLGSFAFPIFLMHEPLVTILKHLLAGKFKLDEVVVYCIVVASALCVPIAVYLLLRRWLPAFGRVIFGGR
jgi:hypothetical protein